MPASPATLQLVCLSDGDPQKTPLDDALARFGSQVSISYVAPDAALDSPALATADGVLCNAFPLDLRRAAPAARWIQIWNAGVERDLYPELFDCGKTVVANGSGIHAASASEHVLALMLAFSRGLPSAFAAQQQHDWSAGRAIRPTIFDLEGKTVGIVGAGVIGQAIGKRCQAFGMRTVGSKRDTSQPVPGIDVLMSHLQYHDLILESDLIVLALPLTPHTQLIFGEDEIEIVRKGTYLFNIGRGGLIDEVWLLRALQNGWLAGAGLDVFTDEPLPPESPFWSLPNCIITPHLGGATPLYWTRFAALVADQCDRLLGGRPLRNQVDPHLGY